MTETHLLCREGIDALRNKSFLDLLRGEYGDGVGQEHALMCLAACLGLIPPGCDNWKDVLYSRDPVTNMLCDLLKCMVEAGLLKYDAENNWYRPIDLRRALFVDDTSGDAHHVSRSYELRDKKLLWAEDIHRSVNEDGYVYIEDSPEPGKRWKFAARRYWSKRYP